MQGHLHKRIAVALQDRRLVKISKKGGDWRAVATDAGRHYLEHGDYPDGFWTIQKPLSIPPQQQVSQGARSETSAQRASTATGDAEAAAAHAGSRRTRRPKRVSVTEQLIADVIAAGGELRIDREKDKTDYDRRVAAAIRHGKVPEGKLLVIERGSTWRERIIRLQDPPEWMTVVLEPIPVPGTLRKPHKVVAALKDDTDLFRVTTRVRGRACRLLQALIVEAERRGYTVRSTNRAGRSPRYYSSAQSLLTVTISGHDFGVDLTQQVDRVEHMPTATELRRAERESWYRIPTHDDKPSDRLAISITNGRQYRQSNWSDSAKSQLEELLPQILQELELRAGFAEQQRLEEERKRAEREQRWKAAMECAEAAFREDHRAKLLQEQLSRWQTAQALDGYLTAMQAKIETLAEESERESAQAWLAWAQEYRQKIDPLSGPPAMPETPNPHPSDLEPFLNGWSPYGPHTGRW